MPHTATGPESANSQAKVLSAEGGSPGLSPASARPALRRSLIPFGTSIFGEMTRLAQTHGAINLAQGFPDFDGPDFIKEAAAKSVWSGPNQYARSQGLPVFVEAVAEKYQRFYGLSIDPMTQVGVYSGATEAIFDALMALTEPGDEVIVFEPFYDSYPASLAMAGAIPRFCRLRAPDFSFDVEELKSLFTPRTRLILINTPHNPTGKVFSRQELEQIAALCKTHNVIAVTDEVYEHLTYDGVPHIPMATLPGMFERTLTLNSTGKTFSMTGWKIGYAVGPAPLISAVQAVHQFVTFATATPFQAAMAQALRAPDAEYQALQGEFLARRDFLLNVLLSVGFEAYRPSGTYFILTGYEQLSKRFGPFDDDVAFARFMTQEIKVACIPPSSFYHGTPNEGQKLVRFAFCKQFKTLEEAAQRLQALRKGA